MGSLRLGTSSWSEKGWVGSFYPAGMAARDFLGHYATRFSAVEADNTYYAVPSRDLVRGWARKVPEGFLLAAKFPRSIVHAGEGPRPAPERVLVPAFVQRERDDFLESMSLLGPKCGPLVLQFPYFNRSAFPSPAPFLERLEVFLEGLPPDFRYGVEVRNRAWIGEPLLDILRCYRVALVLVELPYMPHPDRLAGRLDLLTADFAYARLIGDRAATEALTRTFDAPVLDQSENLHRWAAFLRPVIARARETFAFANNHYAGHGPATIRELARLLREGDPDS